MIRKISLFTAGLLVSCALLAQDKVVKQVMELGKTDNRTMQHADFLANRIGGRPVGSHNLQDAEAWVAEQFKSWGLEVIIQEVGEVNVGFSRGPWSGRMIGGDGMQLHFVTPTYTAGTKGPQRGRVYMEPQTDEEFNRIKGCLKGAWVLVGGESGGSAFDWTPAGDKRRAEQKAKRDSLIRENRKNMAAGMERGGGRGERPRMPEVPKIPGLYYREMVEAGVAGFIQAAQVPMQAHYDRHCFEMTMDNLPTVCEIKLDKDQYVVIEKMVRERRDFELEFDIRNHFFKGPVKYHNIIGVMKGSKYPGEYVLMGGHLDAYDVASGAVDDGNGVSVTMEAARLLAASGAKPKRTMMFCIWTGEEYGLLGSKYFVENKTVPLEKISNYFNRDFGPLAATGITVTPAMFDDFKEAAKPILNYTEDIPFAVNERKGEARPRPTSAGGSDHAYFAMNGVPTFSFAESDVKGYNFNYREIWHTESDNYNKLFPEYLEHSAVITAVVAYGIANLPHILSRDGLYTN